MNQAVLRRFLSYDPSTGIFRWIISTGSASPGKIAGCDSDDGYLRIRLCGILYLAHRLAWLYMTSGWPVKEIDHINGRKHDNSWSNLREATHSQNLVNSSVQSNNKLGVKGVSFNHGQYVARVQKNRRLVYIKRFKTLAEAANAYKRESTRHYGEYVR